MINNKGYLLYIDTMAAALSMLSDRDAGQLIKAIQAREEARQTGANYAPGFINDKSPLSMAYGFIISALDRNAERYSDTCAKRAEAARSRGANNTKKQTNANEEATKQTNVNYADIKQTNTNEIAEMAVDRDRDRDRDKERDRERDNDNESVPWLAKQAAGRSLSSDRQISFNDFSAARADLSPAAAKALEKLLDQTGVKIVNSGGTSPNVNIKEYKNMAIIQAGEEFNE